MGNPRRRSIGHRAILLAAAGGYAVFAARSGFSAEGRLHFTLFDDAMISMRYARNLASGHGLVWNPGGEAVEGYTNLLWTLWMALCHALPIPEAKMALAVMVSGAALLLANLCVVRALALEVAGRHEVAAPVAVALAAGSFPLVFWTLRGMEVGLLALLLATGALLAIRLRSGGSGRRLAAFCAVLAASLLCRPDALIFVALLVGYVGVCAPAGQRLRALLPAAASVAVTLAGHTLFRWFYYGDLLPNSFYLKLAGIPLAERLPVGIDAALGVLGGNLLVPVALAVLALVRSDVPRAPAALLAALFGAQLLYSIAVGGDAWEWMGFANRYVAVGVPALAVLSALGVARIVRVGRAAAGFAAAGVLLASDGPTTMTWLQSNYAHRREEVAKVHLGLHLREHTSADARIAVVWAGAIPYFAHREGVDLLGRNDKVIARRPSLPVPFVPGHSKWDYRYSIGELRPDVITELYRATEADEGWVRSQGYRQLANGLWVSDRRPGVLQRGIGGNWWRTGEPRPDLSRARAME